MTNKILLTQLSQALRFIHRPGKMGRHMLRKFCKDILQALEYLESQGIVHDQLVCDSQSVWNNVRFEEEDEGLPCVIITCWDLAIEPFFTGKDLGETRIVYALHPFTACHLFMTHITLS